MSEPTWQETGQLARALDRHQAFREVHQAILLVSGEWALQNNTLEFTYKGSTYLAEVSRDGIRLKRPQRFSDLQEIPSFLPSGIQDIAGAIALVLDSVGRIA